MSPVGPFRDFWVGVDASSLWTTDWERLGTWFRPVFFEGNLRNNWGFNVNPIAFEGDRRRFSLLRGGPSIRLNTWHQSFFNVFSDRRKPLSFRLGMTVGGVFGTPAEWTRAYVAATWRPTATVNVQLRVNYRSERNPEQWITRQTIADSTRYVLASIRQKTLNTNVRLDWTLSPNLSFQLYAQPFVSAGKYSSYLEVDDPEARRWADRFHFYGDEIACVDSECEIDRDSDGVVDGSFGRPDFNFKSLRMTSVLRWEYVPGSVLFVAWQHGRSDRGLDGEFGGLGAVPDLFGLESDNTLLVKFSYWLAL